MILACNKGCGNSTPTTEGKLDLETNEVICTTCGVTLEGVTKFTKASMKMTKDVIKKSKKAFMFACLTCNKDVQAIMNEEKVVVGKNCPNEKKGCKINISKCMKTVIGEYANNDE